MARTHKNRKVQVAAVLLSMCALGGIATLKPQLLFEENAILTASALTLDGCELECDPVTKTAKIISYTGTATSLTLPVDINHKVSDGWTYLVGEQVFKNNTKLQSVSIPSAYTEIQSQAFYGCTTLKTVTFAEGLQKINASAFRASGITAVAIPKSLTSIGAYAFYNCKGLKRFEYVSGASYSDVNLKTIGGSAFAYCSALETVRALPSSLTAIGTYAFYDCDSLQTMDMDYTKLTSIPAKMCGECDNLTTVWLPRGGTLTTIYEGAFIACGMGKDLNIKSFENAIAYDTTNFQIKKKISLKKSDGTAAKWIDVAYWSPTFTCYPNTALHYALVDDEYDLAEMSNHVDCSAGIRFWYNNNGTSTNATILADPKINEWTGSSAAENITIVSPSMYSWPQLTNLEIPIPGKAFDASQVTLGYGKDYWEIVSTECYSFNVDNGISTRLPNGSRYVADGSNNYYYKVQVKPKAGYFLYLPNCSYIGNGDSSIMEKKGIFSNEQYISNSAKQSLFRIVSANASTQVFELYAVVNLQDAKIGVATTGANGKTTISYPNPAPYANKNYVTTKYGQLNANHPNNTYDNSKNKYTVFALTPNTVTSTFNSVSATDVFDCSDYYNLGGSAHYYGLKKSSSNDSIRWTGTTSVTKFNSLEPDTYYSLYFGVKSDSNYITYNSTTFKTDPEVNLKSASVDFGSSLGLAFKVNLTDRPYNSNSGYAYISLADGSNEKKLNPYDYDGLDDNDPSSYPVLVSYPYYVASKQMYDPIRFRHGSNPEATLTKGTAHTVLTEGYFDYSIVDYLNNCLNSSNAKVRALAQATKDYGIASQRFFNYNTDLIPSADFTKALDDADSVTGTLLEELQSYKTTAKPMPDYMVSRSFKVAFDEDNTLRLTMKFKTGTDVSKLKFFIDGKQVTPTPNGTDTYYLQVKGIKSTELNKEHSFVVKQGNELCSMRSSVLAYCRSLASGSDSKSQMLGKTAFLYWKAADAYFAS